MKIEFVGFVRLSSYTSNLQINLKMCTLTEHDAFIHDGESVNKMDKGWSPVTTNKRKEMHVIYREGKLEGWPKES
jgi:hypothetical protein